MVEKRLLDIEERLEKIAFDLEKAKIGEYTELMNSPRRLLYINFVGGLARGLGTAIGLSVLAAIVLYILRQIVDLPLIGQYIANLLDIIDNYR